MFAGLIQAVKEQCPIADILLVPFSVCEKHGATTFDVNMLNHSQDIREK